MLGHEYTASLADAGAYRNPGEARHAVRPWPAASRLRAVDVAIPARETCRPYSAIEPSDSLPISCNPRHGRRAVRTLGG